MARGKTVRASSKRSGQSKTTTTSNRPELFPETDYYLPPGTLLDNGKYEILGVLGSPGGFGITYKARWLSIDRIVAIKEFFVSNNNLCSRSSSGFQIVAREPEEYEKMKKKFLDEARFLFDLKHKYIVKIFDFFEENNTAYLVMEYLEGPRLKDLIEEKDKLEYREAEDLIRKIADALIYIHQNGIIHRDISPENIVFRDKSCQEPVLIDFGLAKEYTAERTRSVTAVRDGFAPLESYSANAKKGPYTDIYSLGAILYYILLGEEPPNANDIVLGLPLSFPDWLDQRYVNVISKAMETRVEKRFSSVKDFILALEGYKLAEDKKNKAGYKRKSKEVFAFQSKLILIKKEDRIKFQQKFEGKDLKKVLFGVIDNGQIEEVVWLLEQGVDVNIKYYGITPLHKAVQNNRLEIIEILLLAGAGINIKDRYGRVPLYYAIGNKNREIVHLLISVGADLNVADNYNVRLLEYAIKVGNAEIVEMLLANGADIDFLSKDGYTPIYLAIKGNNKEIVEILLQYGAKIEIRYLFDAIRMSSIGIAELLIQYGADVNGQTLDGYTPLHQAVQAKDSALVKLLLTHGADPRIPNSKGETPYDLAKEEIKEVFFEYFSRGKDLGEELIRTSEEGDEEYVKWLLERGANVNAATSDGNTALHKAAKGGHREVVKILLEYGADAEAENSTGWRPRDLASEEIKEVIFEHYARGKDLGEELIRASEEGDEEYVKWLLERGADVNAATSDGVTTLHIAVREGFIELVRLLLEHGADAEVVDSKGNRPRDLASEEIKEVIFEHYARGKDLGEELIRASEEGDEEYVKWLLERGANVNAATSDGNTALHWAARKGSSELVKILLEHGADPAVSNSEGKKPYQFAESEEIKEVIFEHYARGKDLGEELIRASEEGDEEYVKWLLERGADVNAATSDGNTALHWAARKGSSELVKILLEHGADPAVSNSEGKKPYQFAESEEIKEVIFEHYARGKDLGEELIRASEEGDEEYVKWLLERGANVNAATSDGVTTLHIAVREGFIELVRLLLEHGADAEVVDSKGNRPRDLASEEIKEVIFEHYARGKDLGEELIRASEEGDEEYVKWLLERGADVNAATSDGNTALHLAAQKGHTDIVKLLLEYGADPLASNVRGKRAYDLSSNEEIKEILFKHVSKGKDLNIELLEASKGGDLEYAKWLIKKKTNPNITLYDGNTPLHLAAQQGHLNIVKLLLDNGADPLAFNVEGYRAHHLAATNEIKNNLFGYISKEKSLNYELTNACKDGDLEYAKWLIEKGANINTLDYQGFSPLHWAIGKGNFELVELLLKHGADVNLKAADTTTPLHIAVQRNHTQIIDLLLRYGVDVNAVTLDGNTPLHWAAKQNALEIIEVLLNHGADPNVLNSLGVRPHDLINENVREFFFRRFSEGKNLNEELLMASKRGDFEYTKWLLEKGGKTDVFDPEGNTPLHLAAENGHEEVALFLFEQGGDLQAENNRGETPLSVATPEVKSLLLGKALIEALDRRNFFYVKRLIRQGAEVNMKNKMGKAPLHIAVEEKTLDFVEFLLSNRANPNVRDREGNTPLHYAAKEGDRRMVELLLSKGADREIKNYKGQRPYNVARNIYVLVLL